MLCCCGSKLDGSHDHNTCGPPIPEEEDLLEELLWIFCIQANASKAEARHYAGTPTGDAWGCYARTYASCADEVGMRMQPRKKLVFIEGKNQFEIQPWETQDVHTTHKP